MKIGIAVIARLQSSRLKEKHLRPVLGRPILSYLLSRIKRTTLNELVIATANNQENKRLELFGEYGARVFYGAESNIPLRLLELCNAYNFDAVVSVDGDDILCAVSAILAVQEGLQSGADYLSTIGLPLGLNAAGYSLAFLERSLSNHQDEILETGWGRVFDKSKLREISFAEHPAYKNLRFTLDYSEDLLFFEAVISHFADIVSVSDQEIIDYVIKQELYKLNETIAQKYWEDFQSNVAKEKLAK